VPKIITLPLYEILPYEHNPRINDAAVDAVAESITQFKYRNLISVDVNHVIISGHTRLKALQKLGWREADVQVIDDLDPDQVRALRIADNKTGELAEWDMEKLLAELTDLQSSGFDISTLAFDDAELTRIMNGEALQTGRTEPDAVPAVPEVSNSRRGCVYMLGAHRLMCGDATQEADIATLMSRQRSMDLWLTDPPYNVAYEGGTGLTIQNDNMDDAAFASFLAAAFTNAAKTMKPGASFYIFHADSEGYNFRNACRAAGLQVRQCLVWKKDSLVLGRQDYQWIHEPCLYGWKDGAAHSWYSDRSQTTVMEFAKPHCNADHPTMKPVEMLVYLLKNSSQPGAMILDTFGGSGSTLIAAEQTNRTAYLMELDPRYCDVIRRRWAEFVHGSGCDWQKLTPEVKNE